MVAQIADVTTATGETVANKINEWIAFCANCSAVASIASPTTATGESTAIKVNTLIAACATGITPVSSVTTATPEAVAIVINLVIAAGCTVTPPANQGGGGGHRDRGPRRVRPLPSGFGAVPDRGTRQRPDNEDEALLLLLD